MSALDAWGGALLLEPVGTGKTWIGLGVAACESRPALAIVPAILQEQWRAAARRAGLTLHLWTHERASRGGTPGSTASLVIIDEAHRFRDPATRRTQTIAPWLAGRRTLLLTATPIVNRLADLISLLRLALPEDALALDGLSRLGDIEQFDRTCGILRRVAIRSAAMATGAVPRCIVRVVPGAHENDRADAAVTAIRQLALSNCAAIRRVLAAVLLDAAASSDAAFYQALKRYHALLLQGRDAGGASRTMLRHFAGEALDQLVLWPLLARDISSAELPLEDIPRVERVLPGAPNDEPWIEALTARCTDAKPTIWFSRHRATARQLRLALGDTTAWITGSGAGIGPHRLSRDMVLAAFGPQRRGWRVRRELPGCLVATDVAAEGLDLQAAGRIVHVDLPWTATRIEQREGRLARLGQQHDRVEVVVRLPARAIECALAPHARVRRKRRLADDFLRALEADGGTACDTIAGPVVASVADDGEPVTLVAVRLQRGQRVGTMLMLHDGERWLPSGALDEAIVQRLGTARRAEDAAGLPSSDLAAAAGAAVAAALAGDENASPALVTRIHRLARRAATTRDGAGMQRLDGLLRFVTASPTLGARMIIARLAAMGDLEFMRADVPEVPQLGTIQAQVIVALVCRKNRPPP